MDTRQSSEVREGGGMFAHPDRVYVEYNSKKDYKHYHNDNYKFGLRNRNER